MATITEKLHAPKEHLCDQCGVSYVQRQHLLRHVRRQHGGVWRCGRCSSSFKREDNYTYHIRNCEFRAGVKRPAEGQIGGGSKPKTQCVVRPEWQSQTLNHTVDKHKLDLEKIDQTSDTILNVLKYGLSKLKVTSRRSWKRNSRWKSLSPCMWSFTRQRIPPSWVNLLQFLRRPQLKS